MVFRLSVIAGSERMNINEKRYCKLKQVRCRLKQFTQETDVNSCNVDSIS